MTERSDARTSGRRIYGGSPTDRRRTSGADRQTGQGGRGGSNYGAPDRTRERTPRRRSNLLVRIVVGLLIVLAVGAIAFLIGYLIGLKIAVLALLSV